MNINDLLKLVNDKIEQLKKEEKTRSEDIVKIQHIQSISTAIKDEPFNLYTMSIEGMKNISQIIEIDDTYLEDFNKNKIIYDAYLKFGRESVPQISLVEEATKKLQISLDEKIKSLNDEIEKLQQKGFESFKYEVLREELTIGDKPITRIELINSLLDENKIDIQDKISIKLNINEKNNNIYIKMLTEKQNEEIVPTLEDVKEETKKELTELEIIDERLRNSFTSKELANLQMISDGLNMCTTKEEFTSLLEQWKYSFGNMDWSTVVEGIIDFKTTEKLRTIEIVGDDIEQYTDDLSVFDNQLNLLTEYYDELFLEEVVNKEQSGDETLSKLDSALNRYTDDVFATPNLVLYLTDSLDKDIRSLDDKETLEDVFILIEQLKYNETESVSKFTNDKSLRDLYEIKPSSKGKQARVVYAKLGENVYGLISISGKKADSPKSWKTTLEQRRKNCDVDRLKNDINNLEALEGYIDKTKEISNKLYESVSPGKLELNNNIKKI